MCPGSIWSWPMCCPEHQCPEPDHNSLEEEVEAYVDTTFMSILGPREGWRKYNSTKRRILSWGSYCETSWPAKRAILGVLIDARIQSSNPASLWVSILDRLHTGHQTITKCWERAKQSVWWPGLSHQVEEIDKNNIFMYAKFFSGT